LAPLGDAEQLRTLIDKDNSHRALYQVFLDVRDAAAKILENTTLADIVSDPRPSGKDKRNRTKKQKQPAAILPMVSGGSQHQP
jgi:DNA-binding IscR family transcriptional regulator